MKGAGRSWEVCRGEIRFIFLAAFVCGEVRYGRQVRPDSGSNQQSECEHDIRGCGRCVANVGRV